ncbi:MAG: hypothetical protein FWF22_04885 [Treponema sp.]|nr:hypothetical protein [Treponema sp.]
MNLKPWVLPELFLLRVFLRLSFSLLLLLLLRVSWPQLLLPLLLSLLRVSWLPLFLLQVLLLLFWPELFLQPVWPLVSLPEPSVFQLLQLSLHSFQNLPHLYLILPVLQKPVLHGFMPTL